MRIGILHGRKYYLRNFLTALVELSERGHELLLALPESKNRPVHVPVALSRSRTVTTSHYPNRRQDDLDRAVTVLRSVRNAVRYEAPQLSHAYANRRRAYRKLREALSADPATEPPPLLVPRGGVHAADAALAELERRIPPNEPLVRFIREQRLDVVVCIGRVNFGSDEADIAKAAHAAGVPSALAVYSWDNLSSKALVHVHPDRLFVWNDFQVDEAVDLHGIARESVVAIGAPRFDEFFSLAPSAPRQELVCRLGLDPTAPTVLYLGSSGFVTKQEPEFIERWIRELRANDDGRLTGANIIVRPHPGTLSEPAWNGWGIHAPGVVMPPPRRHPQDLYDQIFVADAIVALNTSAELEAGIVGRPVLTIEVGELAPGQEGSSHFHYLLAEHGGFVQAAGSLEEHIDLLRRALAEDSLAEQRSRFIERFVRPRGLDRPAGPELADEIEALAGIAQVAL
jgi:hypothetical protein